MDSCRCCSASRATKTRRLASLAAWALPGGLLAIMPKCPLCVAAYVAMATGLGLSFSAAWILRWGLIAGCVSILLGLVVRQGYRWFATRHVSKVST